MITLALVGKNIQHSLSPQVYADLLGSDLKYHLLDYPDGSDIPKLEDLFCRYSLDGLSITAPYKKHFLDQLSSVNKSLQKFEGVNCIKKTNKGFYAINTDYLAVKGELINLSPELFDNVIILGDGVMSKMTQVILDELGVHFQIYSRRLNFDMDGLSFDHQIGKILIINSCARDYLFRGKLPSGAVFWDFNYNHIFHESTIPDQMIRYIDGTKILKLQALEALKFWDIKIS